MHSRAFSDPRSIVSGRGIYQHCVFRKGGLVVPDGLDPPWRRKPWVSRIQMRHDMTTSAPRSLPTMETRWAVGPRLPFDSMAFSRRIELAS